MIASMQLRVRITPDGMLFLSHPALVRLIRAGGDTETIRISHVEPVNLSLRRCFRLLRFCFGDYGRVADWTRTWECFWRVDFSPSGGVVHTVDAEGRPFRSHAAAVLFERPFAEAIFNQLLLEQFATTAS